jgi:hypothetical protein
MASIPTSEDPYYIFDNIPNHINPNNHHFNFCNPNPNLDNTLSDTIQKIAKLNISLSWITYLETLSMTSYHNIPNQPTMRTTSCKNRLDFTNQIEEQGWTTPSEAIELWKKEKKELLMTRNQLIFQKYPHFLSADNHTMV